MSDGPDHPQSDVSGGGDERLHSGRTGVAPRTSHAGASSGRAAHGFRGPQVCTIVGITYRQLDYWARTDLLRPSIADARGSGSQRRYSYTDLLELKVIKGLIDAGVSLASARAAVVYLRDHLGEDLASANLVLCGETPLLLRDDGDIIDLVRKGQGVLQVVPLGGVKLALDASISELLPTVDGDGPADALRTGAVRPVSQRRAAAG